MKFLFTIAKSQYQTVSQNASTRIVTCVGVQILTGYLVVRFRINIDATSNHFNTLNKQINSPTIIAVLKIM